MTISRDSIIRSNRAIMNGKATKVTVANGVATATINSTYGRHKISISTDKIKEVGRTAMRKMYDVRK